VTLVHRNATAVTA